MLERDFAAVLESHPDSAVALYDGATALGIFQETVERLYDQNGSAFTDRQREFTYLTSTLPPITKSKVIRIKDKDYKISFVYQESSYLTRLILE